MFSNADAAETPEFSYRIEFIESAARVDEVLPTLYEMVADGLIEVQDTTVIKAVNKDRPSQAPALPWNGAGKKAQLMRIFLGERDKWHGDTLYERDCQATSHDGYRRRHRVSRNYGVWGQGRKRAGRAFSIFSEDLLPI